VHSFKGARLKCIRHFIQILCLVSKHVQLLSRLQHIVSTEIRKDWVECHSERSTSTLTTCSATSSVDCLEGYGIDLSVSDSSSFSALSRMSIDESISSTGSSQGGKLKRRRDIDDAELRSFGASHPQSTTFREEESPAKRQNVPLVRPVPRYASNSQDLPILSISSNRQVPPKSMCAMLGIFKPVATPEIMSEVTARTITVRADQDRCSSEGEEDDDLELALYFHANSSESGPVHIDKGSRTGNVSHREGTCDPLMCIFNMDL